MYLNCCIQQTFCAALQSVVSRNRSFKKEKGVKTPFVIYLPHLLKFNFATLNYFIKLCNQCIFYFNIVN